MTDVQADPVGEALDPARRGLCLCESYARVTERAALAGARWLGRADQDAAEDAAFSGARLALEGLPITGHIVIGGALVGPAQPARARERGALRHARVALAEAELAARGVERLLARVGLDVGHGTACSRSADESTSSITAAVVCSALTLSMTGVAFRSARATM